MHVWLEKIARIQAALVNSLTMKTLTDGASVFNCMMPRLKTRYVMFNYDEHIPVLPYNNHRRWNSCSFSSSKLHSVRFRKSAYSMKKKVKKVNLCCNCIYISQLTVQILIDNDITKQTIHQQRVWVQSIQIYHLLSYPLLLHLLASSDFT